MPKRDFTGPMLEKIQREIDSYFNSITSLDRASFYVLSNTLPFLTENCMSNYIMSLSMSKEKAENKIKAIWKAIFEVEDQYKAKFEYEKTITESYKNALKSISDCINTKSLSTTMDFNKISAPLDKCYALCIEKQAREIIDNKSTDKFTDGDIEVIGYAYMNTMDSELKADILNKFYTKVDSGPESYFESLQVKSKWDKDTYYYKRSDKYKDFQIYVDHYLGVSYQQYLNKEIDDAKINWILNSHKQAYAISDVDTIISDKQIFDVDEYGNISYVEKSVNVIGNSTVVKRTPLERYDWIDEGEGASAKIDDKVANSILDEYDAKVDAIISGYGKNLAEGAAEKIASLIPGGGEFLDAAKDAAKVVETIVKTSKKTGTNVNTLFFETTDSKTNDTYADNYIEWFDMKCTSSNNNYTFLPTPDSLSRIEGFFEWLENDDNIDKGGYLYKTYHYDSNSSKSKYEYFLELDPYNMVKDIRDYDSEMNANWLEYITE